MHQIMTIRRVLLAAAVLTVPAIASAADEVARNVRVMPLQTRTITQYLEVAGPLVPVRGADISSEESGTVRSIGHDKGARVAAGTVLLTLDRNVLKAELAAAEAALNLQEYSYQQIQKLHDAGKASRLDLLQAAASAAQARSQHDVTRTRYARSAIKAPFDGIVADRFVEAGELVAPGMRVARVIDPYVLKLAGSLTEREVCYVEAGDPATIVVEGVDGPVAATVGWVGFEADRLNGKFPVEVHVPNPDLDLRSGAIGRARLTRSTVDGQVVIPRDAVMPVSGAYHVFVVEGDRARKRVVDLGEGQGLMVAVVSGLAADDLLVVRGQRELRDGSLVSVVERVAYGDGTNADDPDDIRASAAATRISAEVNR